MAKAETLECYDASVEVGLPVIVEDGVIRHADGSIEIPEVRALIATAAVARALIPLQLSGAELRFMRKSLRLTIADISARIGVKENFIVARWENDFDRPPDGVERQIRRWVIEAHGWSWSGSPNTDSALETMVFETRNKGDGRPVPLTLRYLGQAGSDGAYSVIPDDRRIGAYGSNAPRMNSEPDLTGPAIRTFDRIADAWQLTERERLALLGVSRRSDLLEWRSEDSMVPMDVLERISCVFGIFTALETLLPNERAADGWIRKSNSAAPFEGGSALDKMLSGRIKDIREVLRYLDSELRG